MNRLRSQLVSFAPILVILFLFCISSYQLASVICLALLTITWLLSPNLKQSFQTIFQNKALLLLPLFYVLHAVSLLYSADLHYGFFDLQIKLSFLLIPLLLPAFSFSSADVRRFKTAFILGTIVASLLCFIHSWTTYSETNYVHDFFYQSYSQFLHPAYFSMYLTVALLLLLELFFSPTSTSATRTAAFIATIILWISLTLLSSRTAYVTALVVNAAYLLILFAQRKIKGAAIVPVIVLAVSVAAMQWIAIGVYNRYSHIEETTAAPAQPQATPADTVAAPAAPNSASVHYTVWQNAWSLAKQHPVAGVGIGDVHAELNKEFQKNNFQFGVDRNLNPHNQFLHTMVALGLAGLLVLLCIFGYPLLMALKKRNWIYFLFLVTIGLNCMTESILERQAGILFFSFFYCMFALASDSEDN